MNAKEKPQFVVVWILFINSPKSNFYNFYVVDTIDVAKKKQVKPALIVLQ